MSAIRAPIKPIRIPSIINGIFIAILIIDYRLFIFIMISTLIIGYFEQIRISKMNESDKAFRKENE